LRVRANVTDAGVVNQDVETTEVFDRGVDRALHFVVLGDVAAIGARVHACLLEAMSRRFPHLGVDLCDGDAGSLLAKGCGDAMAEALATPGH
jgi:hypothetical protein